MRKLLIYILPVLALFSCVRESPEPGNVELPFSVTVTPEPFTRASFNGSSLAEGSYVFSSGDRLYVSGADGNVHGVLNLVSSDGSESAVFGGSLTVSAGYTPGDDTILSATLVGEAQGSFFSIEGDAITGGPVYPLSVPYASLQDQVRTYSHFTASFPYTVRKFTLTQQTAFVNFRLDYLTSSLTGNPSSLNVDIKTEGGELLRSVTGIPTGGSTTLGHLEFTLACPADASLQGAQTWVENGDGLYCSPDFAGDLVLSPNKYYNAARSAVDPFTIEAPTSGTGASITFNYPLTVQYRRHDGSAWSDWQPYESILVLSAGEKVSFRAKNSTYANSSGTTPIFTTNNPVYIYGDLMSLMCDDSWNKQTLTGDEAFKKALMNCTNVNVHPDKDLVLSAATLGTSCYESMFEGCTGLTKLPVLPATTLGSMCYNRMFYGCTGITSLPEGLLPANNLAFGCYAKMFSNCSNLTTVPSKLLPATTLAKACYHCMFARCTKLTAAPELPATTPQPGCYFTMFRWCTALKEVKCMMLLDESQRTTGKPSDASNDAAEQEVSGMTGWTTVNLWSVFNKWILDVSTTGTFYKNSAMVYATGQVGSIPSGWTVNDWTP